MNARYGLPNKLDISIIRPTVQLILALGNVGQKRRTTVFLKTVTVAKFQDELDG